MAVSLSRLFRRSSSASPVSKNSKPLRSSLSTRTHLCVNLSQGIQVQLALQVGQTLFEYLYLPPPLARLRALVVERGRVIRVQPPSRTHQCGLAVPEEKRYLGRE